MKNNLNNWGICLLLIVGVVFPLTSSAEYQFAISGFNSNRHTGVIYCPNNEKITHFELAFDSSGAVRSNVPYDMRINGNLIYSNSTPAPQTSGLLSFATTTPVYHTPVDCFGSAVWVASSTSPTGNQMRIYYTDINGGTNAANPNYSFTPADRVATFSHPSFPLLQNIIASKVRYANSVYYLATSTSSGGGGGGDTFVTTPNDDLITFMLLFTLWIAVFVGIFKFVNIFYARK